MIDCENTNEVLKLALDAWHAGAELRRRRRRYRDYTYGKQWGDLTVTPSGECVTEEEYARQSGKRPLTNNIIRQTVKSVIGVFRKQNQTCREDVDPDVARRNQLEELDCRLLEEFLISGCAVQRIVSEKRMGGTGVWIDNVSPDRFFVNRFTDPRASDIEIVGMLHDMSLREVLMRFGGQSGRKRTRIAQAYSCPDAALGVALGDSESHSFFCAPAGRCRVIEVWVLESRDITVCHDPDTDRRFTISTAEASKLRAINARRRRHGQAPIAHERRATVRWTGRFLTPGGMLLDETESPYSHGMHPFAVKFYPLNDGEVHSFVEDIIDQQRYINRLITLIDHIMSVSAKGVLLFPIDQKPDDMTWHDIGRLWSDCSGIIPYRPFGPGEPRQIISGSDNCGAYDLLNLEMKLFEQISGVTQAVQGRGAGGNMSAALYQQQTENSTFGLLDIFASFRSFCAQRNMRIAATR